MNLDLRAQRAAADAHASAPDVDVRSRFAELEHVAHARRRSHAAELAIDGGAASFHLDFGGTLARAATARVNTGVAGVDVTIPASIAARVVAKTTLGAIDASNAFTREGRDYLTAAAVAGETPVLTIEATVTLGQLELRTS